LEIIENEDKLYFKHIFFLSIILKPELIHIAI